MKKLTSALFLMIFATAGYITNANSFDFSFSIGAAANHAGFYGEGTEKISDTDDTSDGWRTLDDTEAGAFIDTHSSLFVEIGLNEYIDVGLEHILGDIDTPENVNVQHQGGTEYQLAGKHQIKWDAKIMGSGIYFVIINSGNDLVSERLILIK